MGFTDYLIISIITIGVLVWTISRFSKTKANAVKSNTVRNSGQDLADDYLARFGMEDRATEIPAWGLQIRSPYKQAEVKATSWIGGVPTASIDYEWPHDPLGKR